MITTEKKSTRLQILQEQHDQLDREIQQLQHDFADDATIHNKKRHKLQIKDAITHLEAELSS